MDSKPNVIITKMAGYWRVIDKDGQIDSSHVYKRTADKAARQLRIHGWSLRNPDGSHGEVVR